MMNLGLYGTLLDPDVRALVLGKAWRGAGRPALLRGWARFFVEGQVYPGIRRQQGAQIDVLVLFNVDESALAAADTFEGAEYTREPLEVCFTGADASAETAMFYVPRPTIPLSNEEWRYDQAWRARHHARFMQEARAAMTGHRAVVLG